MSVISLPTPSARKTYEVNLIKAVGGVAVFLSLIPWFSFGLLAGDSMPWPFIGYLFFFLSFKNQPIIIFKSLTVIFLILICGVFSAAFVSSDLSHENVIRSLYNYFGVVVFYLGFYNYLYRYGFPMSVFIAANVLWLLFAVVELFFPDVASIFSTTRTGAGRGVTSLAPEPTFFGMYLFFSSWLMVVGSCYKPGRYLMLLLSVNTISILLIAKSSMIILYLMIAALVFTVYAFARVRIKKIYIKIASILSAVCLILGTFISYNLEGSRYLDLASKVLYEMSLKDLFSIDGSLNSRLEHLVYSVHGAVNNFLAPAGFDAFFRISDSLDKVYNHYFWYGQPSYKIMSWTGDWLFQLGVFGLIFVSYLFYISSDGSRMRRSELTVLAILLLSAIPIAFPLIPMLFALYTYQRKFKVMNRIE